MKELNEWVAAYDKRSELAGQYFVDPTQETLAALLVAQEKEKNCYDAWMKAEKTRSATISTTGIADLLDSIGYCTSANLLRKAKSP